MRGIRVYIEGGGDSRQGRAQLRTGFSAFLASLRKAARAKKLRWEVILCGITASTLEDFRSACETHADSSNILLVDSDGPVSTSPNRHLRLADVDAHQCHLMVQVMESWFLADDTALAAFYGQGFRASALPKARNVERIAKADVLKALTEATARTAKRKYHKVRHGAKLLGWVDPEVVRSRAKHCHLLFTALQSAIDRA